MNLLYKIIHQTPFPLGTQVSVARDISGAFARRGWGKVCQTHSEITVEVDRVAVRSPKVPERPDREGFLYAAIGTIVLQCVCVVLTDSSTTATEKGQKVWFKTKPSLDCLDGDTGISVISERLKFSDCYQLKF